MLTAMRLSALRRRLDACPRVLRDEQGIALVMALGIMMVLTLALGTVIYMTAASARDAQRTNGGQKAYALAEAGLNNVLSQVAANYPNSVLAGNSAWAAGPGSPVSYDGGTVTWGGQYEGAGCPSNTWCLTGTGAVANPTGPGAPSITRTVKARITVSAAPPPYTPYGLFSGDPTASCTILQGGISVNVPVYIASCLTLGGNADSPPAPTTKSKIWDPNTPATVTVQVGGVLTLNGGTTVGTATKDVKLISAGSCVPSPCTTRSNGFYGPIASPPLPPVPAPSVNASTVYNSANWSGATCTSGTNPFDNNSTRNGSMLTVGPETWATFDCSVTDAQGGVHRLAYNSATRMLTIQGSVFIDGNFTSSPNKGFKYTGNGTIYFNGTVNHSGVICGPGSTWTVPGTCGETWDPNAGELLLVACNATTPPVATSFVVQSQAVLEAGAWAVGNSSTTTPAFQSTGNAYLGGSVFTEHGFANIAGGGLLHAFISLPAGAPTTYIYSLANHTTNYSGG